MKKIVLILVLVANMFALDALSGISKAEKKTVNRIVEVLQLPDTQANKEIVYNKLKNFFEKNWSAHWTTNDTGAKSKLQKSKTQICDVTLYNDNRVVNVTFVYFKKEKQLFITLKQYVEAESDPVLKLYNKRKKDPDYSLENETDHYAYFQEKGYMSYETYHITAPSAMVVYESSYIFDIK